jgi:hypothetical protein
MSAEIDDDILEQLISLEPIFHRLEHLKGRVPSRTDFEDMMTPNFFEIGASGNLYTRDVVLQTLEERHRNPSSEPDRWQTSGFRRTSPVPSTWLLSYRLQQELPSGSRITRRTTLWKQSAAGWRILFHQGTPVNPVATTNRTE